MSVLVIAAHPDDEVLGCGGTIARLADEGNDVFIAILGEGITSRYEDREQADKDLLHLLWEKSREVGTLLGAKQVFFFNLPDNQFDTVPLLKIVRHVEKLIHELKPVSIYTHHGGDLNIDHAITFRAVMTATRPVHHFPVRELYTFEIPSSTEWAFSQFNPGFAPNMFMDVSKTLELKIRAMGLYESEIRPFPHPRSPKALRAIAEKWGSTAGLEAAEGFMAVRMIK